MAHTLFIAMFYTKGRSLAMKNEVFQMSSKINKKQLLQVAFHENVVHSQDFEDQPRKKPSLLHKS
jgi:hypothetical protein